MNIPLTALEKFKSHFNNLFSDSWLVVSKVCALIMKIQAFISDVLLWAFKISTLNFEFNFDSNCIKTLRQIFILSSTSLEIWTSKFEPFDEKFHSRGYYEDLLRISLHKNACEKLLRAKLKQAPSIHRHVGFRPFLHGTSP